MVTIDFTLSGTVQGPKTVGVKVIEPSKLFIFGSWKTGERFIWRANGASSTKLYPSPTQPESEEAEAHRLAETKAKALVEAKEILGGRRASFPTRLPCTQTNLRGRGSSVWESVDSASLQCAFSAVELATH